MLSVVFEAFIESVMVLCTPFANENFGGTVKLSVIERCPYREVQLYSNSKRRISNESIEGKAKQDWFFIVFDSTGALTVLMGTR